MIRLRRKTLRLFREYTLVEDGAIAVVVNHVDGQKVISLRLEGEAYYYLDMSADEALELAARIVRMHARMDTQ